MAHTRVHINPRGLRDTDRPLDCKRLMKDLQRRSDAVEIYDDAGMRMCGKKIRYASRDKAEKAARNRQRHGSGKLRVYECPICGGYHISHKWNRNEGDDLEEYNLFYAECLKTREEKQKKLQNLPAEY
jgi:hypothetical protein